MSEKIGQILLGLLAAAVLSAVIMLVQKRKNRTGWAGTVSKIEPYSTTDGDWNTRDYMRIHYIRDDGEIHSFECDATSYPFWFQGLQPGDRLEKPPGEGVPRRVAAAR